MFYSFSIINRVGSGYLLPTASSHTIATNIHTHTNSRTHTHIHWPWSMQHFSIVRSCSVWIYTRLVGEQHCQHDFPSPDYVYDALTPVPLTSLTFRTCPSRRAPWPVPRTPTLDLPAVCTHFSAFPLPLFPVALVLVRAFPLRNSH